MAQPAVPNDPRQTAELNRLKAVLKDARKAFIEGSSVADGKRRILESALKEPCLDFKRKDDLTLQYLGGKAGLDLRIYRLNNYLADSRSSHENTEEIEESIKTLTNDLNTLERIRNELMDKPPCSETLSRTVPPQPSPPQPPPVAIPPAGSAPPPLVQEEHSDDETCTDPDLKELKKIKKELEETRAKYNELKDALAWREFQRNGGTMGQWLEKKARAGIGSDAFKEQQVRLSTTPAKITDALDKYAKVLDKADHDQNSTLEKLDQRIGVLEKRKTDQVDKCQAKGLDTETSLARPPRAPLGLYLGIETLENFGRVRTRETLAATGITTFESTDSGDPPSIGVVVGYHFSPWANVVVGPFATFDYLNQTINHNFAGGAFLGTTTHWVGTVGGKFGYAVYPGALLYGLAGASFLNHDLNVNFATAAKSNVTTPGFMLGLGGEYQPGAWQILGRPVSIFVQYQHTWWGTANFNTPASSPAFNYAFRREDDTVKAGILSILTRRRRRLHWRARRCRGSRRRLRSRTNCGFCAHQSAETQRH